jgi:hypothetical protein
VPDAIVYGHLHRGLFVGGDLLALPNFRHKRAVPTQPPAASHNTPRVDKEILFVCTACGDLEKSLESLHNLMDSIAYRIRSFVHRDNFFRRFTTLEQSYRPLLCESLALLLTPLFAAQFPFRCPAGFFKYRVKFFIIHFQYLLVYSLFMITASTRNGSVLS